jgi:RHS repeat-associated protein
MKNKSNDPQRAASSLSDVPRDSQPPASAALSNLSRQSQLPRTSLAAKPFAKPSFAPENQVPGFTTSFNTSGKGGGAFRDISANYNVNEANGTGSVSLPLPTSASRGNLNPELSLVYDSGAGNGVLGFGWSLSPIPEAITRKTSDGYPCYDDSDVFMFRGAEFVLRRDAEYSTQGSTKDGFRVHTYRPRIDNGEARCERWTDLKDARNVHWRVVSSDNTVSIFGENDGSRIVDDTISTRRIFSWMLTRSYDSWGNAIEYEYKQEDGNGLADASGALPLWEQNRPANVRCRQKYPKVIRYGNLTCARDADTWLPTQWPIQWMFHIIFDYGDHEELEPTLSGKPLWPVRRDVFSSMSAGFEMRSYRLCRRILMFHQHVSSGTKASTRPNLVTSIELSYDEQSHRSVLTKCTITGHSDQHGRQEQQSLPAWEFSYNDIPAPEAMNSATVMVSNLLHVPGVGSQVAEWCDLDGEGLPGLLSGNGSLTYQRNTGGKLCAEGTIFQPPVPLLQQPMINTAATLTLKDIDNNGALDIIYNDEHGEQIGYYERANSDTWSNFSNFLSVSSSSSSESIAMDITGKGLGDTVLAMDDSLSLQWREGLGKDGVSVQLQPVTALSETRPPRIFRTSDRSTFTADMTGDGHADLVEIGDGCVTYWMNAGHGTFSEPVDMANPPRFSDPNWVLSSRLHLIDVDGSGTTDIVYLLPNDGAMIYYNQAGNSWSKGVYIDAIPFAMRPSSFFTLDILGQGTASICWVDSSQPNFPLSIEYLDLMCGRKPHIMHSFSNGLGVITTFEYQPSTFYCLEDLARGTPWSTKLAFPVQCVSKVTILDKVNGNTSTTSYKYHNGAYDSVEQQFAGFEMVETIMSESAVVGAGDETYRSLPTHTKSWFNVGLSLEIDKRHFFSASQVANSLSSRAATSFRPEVLRTLRGAKMRSEVFESASQPHPLQIEELAYDLDIVQPGEGAQYSVTRMTPRTSLTTIYEKDIADPRIEHDIVLRCNQWGDIEQSLSIVYPRSEKYAQETKSPQVCKNQLAGNVSFVRSHFTNDILGDGHFRRCSVWRYEDYEILNFSFNTLLSVEAARSYDFASLSKVKGTTTWATLRSEERIYFLDNTLEKRLPGGQVEVYSVPDQSFSRTFSPDIVSKMSIDAGRIGMTDRFNELFLESGYVKVDKDDSWWTPCSSKSFGVPSTASFQSKLEAARRSFYTPTFFKDAFGNTTKVQMDTNFLLIKHMEDPVGNTMTFEYDMAHMIPNKITDANGTSQQVYLDALGRTIATATSGSTSAAVQGDRLDQPLKSVSWADAENILSNPTAVFAKQCLGNAATRTLYLLDESRVNKYSQPLAMILQLSRDRDVSQGEDFVLHVELLYLDGQGAAMQRLQFVDPADATRAWKVESIEAATFSGKMKRTFQPFYTSGPQFVSVESIHTPFSNTFNDVRGRCVASLLPNHTWTKTTFTAWSKKDCDAGNTIDIDDPGQDPDVGMYFKRISRKHYFPSWLALQQSEAADQGVSANKSTTYQGGHFESNNGCCGLPIEEARMAGSQMYTKQFAYDYSGNLVRTFDALGRLVEKNRFDGTGRLFYTAGMDNGEQWILLDINSKPRLTWDTRGVGFIYEYDKLGREVAKLMAQKSSTPKLVVKTIYGEQVVDSVSRNLKGEIWKVYDQSGIHLNETFDIRRNCTQRSLFMADEYKQTLNWSMENACGDTPYKSRSYFDAKGRLVESIDAKGGRTRITYNRMGHAAKVERSETSRESAHQWQTYLASAQYTADNQPEARAYGNGITTRYTYDPFTRQMRSQKTTQAGKSAALEDLAMTYDCLGREVLRTDASEQEKFFRNCKVKPERAYTYDAIGQLTSARGRGQLPGGNKIDPYNAASGNNPNRGLVNGEELYEYEESYTYDLAGNIVQVRHAPVSATTISGWTRNYCYETQSALTDDANVKSNRLSRTEVGSVEEIYAYEGPAGAIGCMTKMPGFTSITWNTEKLMASCSTQTVVNGSPETTYYVYDWTGQRVRKVTERAASGDNVPTRSRDTVFLDGVEIQRKFKGDGVTVESAWARSEVVGQDLIASIESSDKEGEPAHSILVRYHIGDNMELDDLGQLISYEEYSPFGTPMYTMRRQDVEASRKYRLAQYEYDEESGFLYCEARYYCPWLGRWTSPDPLGTADGLNVYAYVSNDPINFVDPEGLSRITKNFPKQNKGGEEDIESINTTERRPGMIDINENFTPGKEFDLIKLRENKINSEKTFGERLTSYFKNNKKDLAIKASTYFAVESLKMVPFPVLGPVISKAVDMALEKLQGDKKLMKEVEKQRNKFVEGSKSGETKESKEWQGFIQRARERSPNQEHFEATMTKAMLYGRELAESHPPANEQPLESLKPKQERTKDKKAANVLKPVGTKLQRFRMLFGPSQKKKVYPMY